MIRGLHLLKVPYGDYKNYQPITEKLQFLGAMFDFAQL